MLPKEKQGRNKFGMYGARFSRFLRVYEEASDMSAQDIYVIWRRSETMAK